MTVTREQVVTALAALELEADQIVEVHMFPHFIIAVRGKFDEHSKPMFNDGTLLTETVRIEVR